MDILRKKGLRYAFRETWRAISPYSFTRYQLRYLRRKYGPCLQDYPDTTGTVPPIIWVCWLQGLNSAPRLVQDCVAQMQRWAQGYEIRIVTAENMADYVHLPEHILTKLHAGQITYTHFSDILRIFLLARHGGIWMDSTVLLTGSLPDYLTSTPLFFYQSPRESGNPHAGSSWLIAAAPHHPVAENVASLLTCYWQHEDHLRDYFLFHDFVTMAVQDTEPGRRALSVMPCVSSILPHTYTPASFASCPIHKLSYKHAIDYHLYIQ